MNWLQTASGRAFDLDAPRPEDVDFEVDIPEALGHLARYAGHAGGYSVAQHCVLGADAIFRDTGDRAAAAAFLLHDAHEAYLGDITTPVVAAIADSCALVMDPFGLGPSPFRRAIRMLKRRLDAAIFMAAYGPPKVADWPSVTHEDLIKRTDIALMNAERRLFLGPAPRPWGAEIDAVPPLWLAGLPCARSPYDPNWSYAAASVWPAAWAAHAWRDRLARYLPERFGAAATRPDPEPRPSGARQPVEA